jgi:hypothetical protein
VTVIESAALPVSSASGSLHEVEDLHLPVRGGQGGRPPLSKRA